MGWQGLLSSKLTIDFDLAAYLAVVDKNAKDLMHEAARAWVKAAIAKVPVYTGIAVSSLKPIGAFANQAIPSGGHTRKTPFRGSKEGHFQFTDKNFIYEFEVSTDVFYYLINEFYDVSQYIHLQHPGPWGSFAAGDAAAAKVIEDGRGRIFPDILSAALGFQ